jgi:hypothetical protein
MKKYSDPGDEIGEPLGHGPEDAVQLRQLFRQRIIQPSGLARLVQGPYIAYNLWSRIFWSLPDACGFPGAVYDSTRVSYLL